MENVRDLVYDDQHDEKKTTSSRGFGLVQVTCPSMLVSLFSLLVSSALKHIVIKMTLTEMSGIPSAYSERPEVPLKVKFQISACWSYTGCSVLLTVWSATVSPMHKLGSEYDVITDPEDYISIHLHTHYLLTKETELYLLNHWRNMIVTVLPALSKWGMLKPFQGFQGCQIWEHCLPKCSSEIERSKKYLVTKKGRGFALFSVLQSFRIAVFICNMWILFWKPGQQCSWYIEV